ncbi:hypothetical protein ACFL9T_19215 [Thermodesulfobacteriota bacterium]
MSEEKYPFKRMNLPPEKKLDLCQRLLWGVIARIVRTMDEKYGEEALEAISESLRDWDYWKASVRQAGVPEGDGTIRDLLVELWGPGDDLCFTVAEPVQMTEDPDENRVLYKAMSCNVADVIGRECPKTCRVVSRAVEEGVARVVNPKIKVSGNKFLSTGDDGCYIWAELEE